MYSFNFPVMIKNGSTSLLKDKEAIRSNLNLLLHCEQGEIFGDPYFGSLLKQALFEPSEGIILDLLIDAVYTTILTFVPQIYLTRKDITITPRQNALSLSIRYVFLKDNTADLYNILLTSESL